MNRPRLARGRAAGPGRGLGGSMRRRLRLGPGTPGLTSLLTHPFVYSSTPIHIPIHIGSTGVPFSWVQEVVQ